MRVYCCFVKAVSEGHKRLFSVNNCSGEDNSAGISFSKESPRFFVIKVKVNIFYFQRNKTTALRAIKAQLRAS